MPANHLFLSDCDGALYDTRNSEWSKLAPLRRDYSRGVTEISNTHELKAALRNGQYAWPGGYQLYFITSDGGALSFEAARAELRQVLNAIQTKANDGWRIVACEINYEDSDLYCDHTGKQIPAAYADDSEGAE